MSISSQSKPIVIESAGIDPSGAKSDVAVLTDGRFVVVWQEVLASPADGFTDTDGAVFARIYDPAGAAASETILVNSWTPGLQDQPSVAANNDGGFSVTFNSTMVWGDAPTDVDAFLINFDASGAVKPFFDQFGNSYQYRDLEPDNPGAGDTRTFMVDLHGGYTAFVVESGDSSKASVTIRDPVGVLTTTAINSFDKIDDVTRLDSGNILIAGQSSTYALLRLSGASLSAPPAGIPGVVAPVTFSTLLSGADATDIRLQALSGPASASSPSGAGFVVTALEPNGSLASTLMLETFSFWGAMTGKTSINVAISLNGTHPAYDVLALKDGTFMVAWMTKGTNGLDILAGHFDADGTALGASVVVQGGASSGDQIDPKLALMEDGRVLVSFTDLGNHAINGVTDTIHAIMLTVSSSAGGFPATIGADVLNGTGGHDGIDGLAGNDRISGLGGNDVLFGGDGNDTMLGGVGNDGMLGGNGNDSMFGGDGADGLSGGAGNDFIRGDGGRDALSGGLGADKLDGGTEADRLDGGAGNDTLTGGTGADVFVFRHDGGTDTITDYAVDDVLRLDHTLWADVGDLTATQVIAQFATVVGSNTVLTFHGGESIILQGFTALVAAELQFV
jgi:Ca2+-binding RTX toxin-like protein